MSRTPRRPPPRRMIDDYDQEVTMLYIWAIGTIVVISGLLGGALYALYQLTRIVWP